MGAKLSAVLKSTPNSFFVFFFHALQRERPPSSLIRPLGTPKHERLQGWLCTPLPRWKRLALEQEASHKVPN